jgi:hypothetical protein
MSRFLRDFLIDLLILKELTPIYTPGGVGGYLGFFGKSRFQASDRNHPRHTQTTPAQHTGVDTSRGQPRLGSATAGAAKGFRLARVDEKQGAREQGASGRGSERTRERGSQGAGQRVSRQVAGGGGGTSVKNTQEWPGAWGVYYSVLPPTPSPLPLLGLTSSFLRV